MWWDPMGVAGISEAADEYDSYLVPTLRFLEGDASAEEITKFLDSVTHRHMDLSTVSASSSEFARRLQLVHFPLGRHAYSGGLTLRSTDPPIHALIFGPSAGRAGYLQR